MLYVYLGVYVAVGCITFGWAINTPSGYKTVTVQDELIDTAACAFIGALWPIFLLGKLGSFIASDNK